MKRPEEDLPCKQLVEMVTDYLEAALPEDDRAQIEHHLGICRGCDTYVERIRTVITLAGELGAEAVPESMKARLLASFREPRE